jgi:hypothetical protein
MDRQNIMQNSNSVQSNVNVHDSSQGRPLPMNNQGTKFRIRVNLQDAIIGWRRSWWFAFSALIAL